MTIADAIIEAEILLDYIGHGEVRYEGIPLPTEDDLPYDDGEPMETIRHREQMNLLIDSLEAYWEGRRSNFFIGGNMFLYFDPLDMRKFRGPDFFFVTDVEERERKSWVVWQEGMRFPDMIVELLSDTTRDTDKGVKKVLYEQTFKTPEYYIYDPYTQEFEGYILKGNAYKTELPDKEKKIFSHAAGLYLVIKDDWLRWMTDQGEILPSYKERVEKEKERAQKEKERAQKEKERAQKEKERAQKEHERAEKEKERAEESEKRLVRTVREMLANGLDTAAVMKYTGLSAKDIEALLKAEKNI